MFLDEFHDIPDVLICLTEEVGQSTVLLGIDQFPVTFFVLCLKFMKFNRLNTQVRRCERKLRSRNVKASEAS